MNNRVTVSVVSICVCAVSDSFITFSPSVPPCVLSARFAGSTGHATGRCSRDDATGARTERRSAL